MTRAFKGVNGARVRENDDDGMLPSPVNTMTARYRSVCCQSGRAILPGDTITYDRRTKRAVLVTANRGADRSDLFVTSGGEFIRNARGRCEDAPCCGCCTI
jgi:hypothetical protein